MTKYIVIAKENLEVMPHTWTKGLDYELDQKRGYFTLASNEGQINYVDSVKGEVRNNFFKRKILKSKSVEELLNDLYLVGVKKSLGYLPLDTIENICSVRVETVINYAKTNNLKSILYKQGECDIGSGALYLFHEQMLIDVIRQHENVLRDAGVPTDSCENYVAFISNNNVPFNLYPAAYIAIAKSFNDERFR